jgi:hypothetical protein
VRTKERGSEKHSRTEGPQVLTGGGATRDRATERDTLFLLSSEREKRGEAVWEKCGKRNLARDSEVESWKQYRAVNDGAEAPKGMERQRE